MDWKKDISEVAHGWLMFLGDFSPLTDPKEKALKGYMHDEEGTCKVYISSLELRQLASACIEAADWLDKRAVDA